ncbi:MAG: helix-turn-helix domain-containing protein [Clostridiales bacterium]|nr:helix-turn-helix domain-containing protein [Clostridiales bacterium]MBD9010647.1 helix-turn-helix domain-containing protein [Clostridiales bacterium]
MMLYKFGENLKSLRTKKGLSQTQLATKLWLNKSIISAYENEQRSPSLDVLIKLSYEFNVSMEYLLGIERYKTLDISGLNDEQVTVVNSLVELLRKENKNYGDNK